jgi:hypothetical protein
MGEKRSKSKKLFNQEKSFWSTGITKKGSLVSGEGLGP